MTTVTVHEAKTPMSRLLARAAAGEEIVIARGRVAIAKLVPLDPPATPRRVPGWVSQEKAKGARGILDHGFWDPQTDEEKGLGSDPLIDQGADRGPDDSHGR